MRRRLRAVLVIVGFGVAVGGAGWLAPPAFADDPCPLSLSFMCRFLPVAPDLDGDIDLTQQLPPANPQEPGPELPPLDPCQRGCV
jgi:hypothetical protein